MQTPKSNTDLHTYSNNMCVGTSSVSVLSSIAVELDSVQEVKTISYEGKANVCVCVVGNLLVSIAVF